MNADEYFDNLIRRNKTFFNEVIRLIKVQREAGIPLKEAVTNVIDNRLIWTAEPTPDERTALIEFFMVGLAD